MRGFGNRMPWRRGRKRRPDFLPIEGAPWWAPWRGWLLLIAWFWFARGIAIFRVACIIAAMVVAYVLFYAAPHRLDWVFCRIQGHTCAWSRR